MKQRRITRFPVSKHGSRRSFLAAVSAGLAGAAFPAFLPRAARAAASERIALAAIGLGSRGRSDLTHFLQQEDVQVVAVCDCFADRRAQGKALVDQHYGHAGCKAYRFHEEVLARDDVDAVLVATGDRWHGVLSSLAARAGKDVYCEKPFSMTVAEGRALVETTKRYGTIWQCGTQRRSNDAYRFVVHAIRRGLIGRLHTITTSFVPWHHALAVHTATPEPAPDPGIFDYDRWLGQSPWAPHAPVRVAQWRLHWDTGAGPIADMGAHYFDVAQWAHDSETSGPVEIEGTGTFAPSGFSEVPGLVDMRVRYADGVVIHMISKGNYNLFEGEEGWIRLTDEGELTAAPASILRERGNARQHWSLMGGHVRNFLDGVKTRRLTVSHPETAHRAHTIAHLANLCLRLGRPLRWDPAAERFVGDAQADNLLARTLRAPWRM